MKRSTQVRLVLLGGVATVLLPGCGQGDSPRFPASGQVYANDAQPTGSKGFYHAPYRGWYSHPYNYKDPSTGLYFHGGNWTKVPHSSVVNLSEPTPAEASKLAAAQGASSYVRRGGFGNSSGSHFFSS